VASGVALNGVSASAAQIPIIDCHIHLFDTTRPQGVPWPDKNNPVLYKPALPDRYRAIATPLGITGAIEVEASPWLEDNQWVLDIAAKDPIIVGTVGNLEPGKPDFAKQLERFHRNRLFRGIRYGNLWDRNLGAEIQRPEFLADIKLLSRAGLTLDSANPTPDLIADVVRLTDKVPDLRVVIDHLPQMQVPAEPATRKTYQSHLHEIGKRPQIYVKISEVFRRVDGQVATDLKVYHSTLDEIFGVFGEDRVIFGSDWPNSDSWKPYPDVLRLVQEYFATKGPAAAEKYFWKNSVKAYRWIKRDRSQPAASA
jgi:predicted TIM-barrel fold metal-dependent hydrolase